MMSINISNSERSSIEQFIDDYNREYGFIEPEQKDFLKELATNLYKKGKVNGSFEGNGEVSPLKGMVSWLKQRKRELDGEWLKETMKGDRSAETHRCLYESYSTVIGDIIIQNKEAT